MFIETERPIDDNKSERFAYWSSGRAHYENEENEDN